MRARNLCIVSLAALGLQSFASAQGLVNVAFTWGGNPAPTGAAYIGSAGDVWNQELGTGGVYSGYTRVNNNLGQATSAFINYISTGAVRSAGTGTQPDPDLTNYYLYSKGVNPFINVAIAGLVPDSPYSLVLYFASDDAGGDSRSLNMSVAGLTSANFYATGNPQPGWNPGSTPLDNIAVVSVLSSLTGTLSITETLGGDNSSGEIDMNGFQIQGQFSAVPEPTSFAIFGVGALGLLIRRLRATR